MLDKIPTLKFTAHCWKYKYCLFCAQRHYVLLLNLAPCRPRLFKRWMAPSTGLKSIQWKVQLVSLILIHWIVIYPVDSAIQLLNNLVQASLRESSPIWASEASFARTKRASRERASEGFCPSRRRLSLARSHETRFTRPNRRACSQARSRPFLCKYFSFPF